MRIKYFDNAKGILIIFIILGHVFSACADYYGYDDDFFKFCSLFMIQCFFFISAYFSSKSKRKLSTRILSMVKTYLIWQMIITIYYSFVLKTMNFSFNVLYPRYTYWFLVTIITYLLLEYLFKKINYKVMIPLSLVISLAAGFIPLIGEWASLARTFTFLPFYVVGFYAKDLNIIEKLQSDKFKETFMVLSVLILILSLVYGDILPYRLLRGKYSYYDVTGDLLSVFLKRIIFYVFSIIVSITFLKVIPKKETIFTKIGQNTLYIYLTQGAILKTLVTLNLMPGNIVLGNVWSIIAVVILTSAGSKCITYFKNIIKERVDNIIWIKNLNLLKSY